MLLKTIPRGKSYTHISISCGPVFFQSTHLACFLPFSFQNEAAESGTGIVSYSKLALKGVVPRPFPCFTQPALRRRKPKEGRCRSSVTAVPGRRSERAALPAPGTALPPEGDTERARAEPRAGTSEQFINITLYFILPYCT